MEFWAEMVVDEGREEGFRSMVDGSRVLTEFSGSCNRYALSRKSRIVVEETTVSRRNFQ
ncbi:unnamed protein product, partial [Musa textilis]